MFQIWVVDTCFHLTDFCTFSANLEVQLLPILNIKNLRHQKQSTMCCQMFYFHNVLFPYFKFMLFSKTRLSSELRGKAVAEVLKSGDRAYLRAKQESSGQQDTGHSRLFISKGVVVPRRLCWQSLCQGCSIQVSLLEERTHREMLR